MKREVAAAWGLPAAQTSAAALVQSSWQRGAQSPAREPGHPVSPASLCKDGAAPGNAGSKALSQVFARLHSPISYM